MPIHIDINEIRVFKAVYDNNGFKKAADKLFVTQSAVSQTIANLEHKLDGLLLQRNPLKLTEAGVRLLNYAEIVLNEERAVLEDIKNIRNGILSTLLLAMNGSVSTLYGSDLDKRHAKSGNYYGGEFRSVGVRLWAVPTHHAGCVSDHPFVLR